MTLEKSPVKGFVSEHEPTDEPTDKTDTYHFDQLRRHLKLDSHLFAGNSPCDRHKFELLRMVREWGVSTNKAAVDGNGSGKYLLGNVIIVLGFGTSLALIKLLSFNYLSISINLLIGRVGSFKMASSHRWRCATFTGCRRVS